MGMGELVYIWGPTGVVVRYSYCHWAAMECYDVHMWMSGFWVGVPRVVPVMGCKY